MSNKNNGIEKVYTCVITPEQAGRLITLFEPCRETVWLSKQCSCTKGGLRGVPTKKVDVLIDDRLLIGEATDWKSRAIEFSVARKSGRFDGAIRDRLTIRIIPRHIVRDVAECIINAVELADSYRVDVVSDLGVVRWTREYPRLTSDLKCHDPERIVMWHWTRYYRHLSHSVAEQAAKLWALNEWAQESHVWTLAEANRSASRALYRASRDEGWRKLTLRERNKLGVLGDAQWHRLDSLPIHDLHSSGAGQATIEASRGMDVDFNQRADDEAYYEELQESLIR